MLAFTLLVCRSLFAAWVFVAPPVRGFRLVLAPEHDENITAQVQRIPPIEEFQKRWAKFTHEGVASRRHRTGFVDANVRMVVGIFSTMNEDDYPYRAVIRTTWMRQQGVCTIEDAYDKNRSDCRIFATFVVGKARQVSEDASDRQDKGRTEGSRKAKTHNESDVTVIDNESDVTVIDNESDATVIDDESDVTVIDAPETLNCGKTRAWFDFAARRYAPWIAHGRVTHIAKMDMDAYLDVRDFLGAAAGFVTDCPNVYGGRPWTCDRAAFCPPQRCGHKYSNHYFKYSNFTQGCWSYMQGGFYFMTPKLALEVSRSDGWWATEEGKCFPEDAIAGKAIYMWARESPGGSQRCVSIMSLQGEGAEAVWHNP